MSPTSPGRRVAAVLAGVVAVAALAVVAYVVLLRGNAADEVTLDAAADAVARPTATATAAATTTDGDDAPSPTPSTPPSPVALDGTWSIVPGEPDTIDDGTFVGYRVQEELAGVGSTTATGRTPAVSGSITIEGSTVAAVEIEADLTQLRSDSSFRDGALGRQGLELNEFPTATFTLDEPVDLPDGAALGEPVEVDAVGELTLHGVTRTVTWPLQAQLVGETIVVVGSLDIAMADFGITPPSAQRVLSIDDAGVAELQLRLMQG